MAAGAGPGGGAGGGGGAGRRRHLRPDGAGQRRLRPASGVTAPRRVTSRSVTSSASRIVTSPHRVLWALLFRVASRFTSSHVTSHHDVTKRRFSVRGVLGCVVSRNTWRPWRRVLTLLLGYRSVQCCPPSVVSKRTSWSVEMRQ